MNRRYFCWGLWHSEQEVLAHFGASRRTHEEIRSMLARAYQSYYQSKPANALLANATTRYFTGRELPNSVLAIFCAERHLPHVDAGMYETYARSPEGLSERPSASAPGHTHAAAT
jgi:hypothetical protein